MYFKLLAIYFQISDDTLPRKDWKIIFAALNLITYSNEYFQKSLFTGTNIEEIFAANISSMLINGESDICDKYHL